MNTWTVYRHYDAAGRLLYIGCTSNLRNRNYVHKALSPWWERITRTETKTFKSKRKALAKELTDVNHLTPLYNRYNGRTTEKTRTYMRAYWHRTRAPKRNNRNNEKTKTLHF